MDALPAAEMTAVQALLLAERPRLVRLCARLAGDGDAAEDLAQETLVEAWRNAHKLRNPEARRCWLTGIARNVCRRWSQRRRREIARLVGAAGRQAGGGDDRAAEVADDLDLEVALALLPSETRAVLIARYIEEAPQAAIAARLGVSEGAVAVRLHRGKLALRHLLTTELREDAAAYGLAGTDDGGWRETRLWCPRCGGRRLGRFDTMTGELALRCPSCYPEPDYIPDHIIPAEMGMPDLFRGVKGYKAALNRFAAWQQAYYRPALPERVAPCSNCGCPAPLRRGLPADSCAPAAVRRERWLHLRCARCGLTLSQGLLGLVLALPEGRRFARTYPRHRLLPERETEAAGRAALVTSLESLDGAARLDVVSARDTYELLTVHGAPEE
jgi:RNA polymerase sigma-70 factor (ECF subfamily)